jgi:phosphatidylserine decarboxylase
MLAVIGAPWFIALITAIAWPSYLAAAIAGLLTIPLTLVIYFFRDPERTPPDQEGVFLASADGEVKVVEKVDEPRFLKGQSLRISVFMSVTDVHVNRSPATGRVVSTEHVPGQFLQAFRPESADVNEHNLVGLQTTHGKVLIKQISGILARRIVCWVEPGQQIEAGDRIGLIKLGSRVDLFLPQNAVPIVKVGDRTTAGETIVARIGSG